MIGHDPHELAAYLSAVLLDEGIITAPITADVRKGKERFVCEARLAERQSKAISKGQRQKGRRQAGILQLTFPGRIVDLTQALKIFFLIFPVVQLQ